MTTREPVPNSSLEHLEWAEYRKENLLTFRPSHPDMLAPFRQEAETVRQVYLNHDSEPYSLKLEEITQSDQTVSYLARLEYKDTLANGDTVTETTPDRPLVETPISAQTFGFYSHQPIYPQLQMQRYEIGTGVMIKWHDENDAILLVDKTANFSNTINLNSSSFELADSPLFDDEVLARRDYLRDTETEIPAPSPGLYPEVMAGSIAKHRHANNPYTVVTIAGRSGSGKSTLIEQLEQELAWLVPDTPVVKLSTDDYHRGLTWLTHHNNTADNTTRWEYGDWDTRIVYDIDKARQEIEMLLNGEPIAKRGYDFGKQEPAEITEYIPPAPIIIIEGIHAGDPAFNDVAHMRYELPTGVATSVGRRIARDFRSGRASGDNVNTPENLLRYMLERAEPAYQAQQR